MTSETTPTLWGERLGEGGEGTVYAYGPGECIKVYKEVDDPKALERKLRALVAARTDRLEQAVAWPREIVYDGTNIRQGAASQTPTPQPPPPPGTNIRQGEGERAVGFTMQRVPDARPVHQVYQARSRQRHFPKADWAFLVRVARNLAACVHFVHEEGLVVGDLNESNVLVSQKGLVRLIDADSFQIERDGFLQTCDVGKGELLAPELQGRSLTGLRRTEQHDLFALAVLVFHLLVVGRHPFAGRPLQPKAGEPDVSLEESIRRGWYAFADPPIGPIFPPPGLHLGWLPAEIREMFGEAFQVGAPTHRPSASRWFSALERLEGSLERCAENDRHVFPAPEEDIHSLGKEVPGAAKDVLSGERDVLFVKKDVPFGGKDVTSRASGCPWCALEEAWSTYLFIPERPIASRLNTPAVIALRDSIVEITLAEDVLPNAFMHKNDEEKPIILFVLSLAFFAVEIIEEGRKGDYLWVMIFAIAAFVVLYLGACRYTSERRAMRIVAPLKPRFREAWADNPFQDRKQKLLTLADRYLTSDTRHEAYRLDILRHRYGNALLHHLGKYSILAADVPTVGFARLEALHRMGILTAADLKRENFEQGMWSPPHVDELMTWRNAIELQFWATSSYTLTDDEEERLRSKIAAEQSQIERQLKSAPQELEKLRDEIEDRRRRLLDEFHRELQPMRKSRIFRAAFKSLNGYDLPDMSGERTS